MPQTEIVDEEFQNTVESLRTYNTLSYLSIIYYILDIHK